MPSRDDRRTPPEGPADRPAKKIRRRDRRNLLKAGAALAAGGAASLFGARLASAHQAGGRPSILPANADNVAPPPDEEILDIQYDLDNFAPGDTSGVEPIDPTQDLEVTAVDFTRGMAMSIGGLVNLDEDLKSGFVSQIQTVEQAVVDGDAELASAELQVLREMVVLNADQLDIAAGPFYFAEITSFSQIILVQIDFLLTLGIQLIGVIYIFSSDLLLKIYEVFEEYKVCLTVTQIIQFDFYLRIWIVILAIRFRIFPGLRISIDILIILISICLRVTVVQSFRICVTRTRRYLLLVEC